jgi:tetratricopeptide (TPR) repeat protein
MSDLEQSYRDLEISPFSSKQEVRAAYKRLVNAWHPDRLEHNPALRAIATEQLKIINGAYSAIQDAGFPSAPKQKETARPRPEPPPASTRCPWCNVKNRTGNPPPVEALRCGACKRPFRVEPHTGHGIRVEVQPPEDAHEGGAPHRVPPEPPHERRAEPATASAKADNSALAAGCFAAGMIALILFALVISPSGTQQTTNTAPIAGTAEGANATALNNLGNQAADRGDWPQAVFHYERAAALSPLDGVIQGNLGIAYARMQRFDLAIPALGKAIAVPASTDRMAELLLWLSVSHTGLRQFSEGLQYAHQVVYLVPTSDEGHYWMAVALSGRGQSTNAITEASIALELNRDHAGARSLLKRLTGEPANSRTHNQATSFIEPSIASEAPRPAEAAPTPRPRAPFIAIPSAGRWANSSLSVTEREHYLQACLSADAESKGLASNGYRYECDEENLTAVQATVLLVHRLLNDGRWDEVISLIRRARAQYPEFGARVPGLVATAKTLGQSEVAYCLDPSNDVIRTEFEASGRRPEGYCDESR